MSLFYLCLDITLCSLSCTSFSWISYCVIEAVKNFSKPFLTLFFQFRSCISWCWFWRAKIGTLLVLVTFQIASWRVWTSNPFSDPTLVAHWGDASLDICAMGRAVWFSSWVILIRQCKLRLHYHKYSYRDTISRWLPTKAEEQFTCLWDMAIPSWMSPQNFKTTGVITIIIINIATYLPLSRLSLYLDPNGNKSLMNP